MDLISSDLPRASATQAARQAAVSGVSAFSADLFAAIAGSGSANLVCSPYSVAVALGMTVQGAGGVTAEQILDLLHAGDAAWLADGLNGIDLALAARSGPVPGSDGHKAERVELATANSLWGQGGFRWQQPFLDTLARDFGTGMRVVDYHRAPEAARAAINAWVSQQTRTRIPKLVPAGAIDADTRLTLANALYFKAPWLTPFEPGMTRRAPFHRLDGSTVSTELMNATAGNRFASGPGWVAVDLPYARGEVAMAVVVPDEGRFAEVQKSLTGEWLTQLLTGLQPAPVQVGLPRWTVRTQVGLADTLAGLGMPAAFTDAADFSAMTTQAPLKISAVVHEGFIAVDEAGTEAAAATAVMMTLASGMVARPRSVVADRPFLYVIHDLPTGTPLFVGRVLDPTAS
jgi:serine protease inhibitor